MKKILYLLLVVFSLSFLIGCEPQDNDTTSGGDELTNVGDIDFSNVKFESIAIDYDGNRHSIYVTNAPEGVIVVYFGNDVSEVGEYTVIAKFFDNEGKLLHEMTALITIYQTYDFSNTKFEGLNVNYDGQSHSVIALNIPDDVTVEYEGNDVSEVGEYIVTAKFYDKYQRLVHEMTATIIIFENYDFTKVTFEDITVDHDNLSHSIIAMNVPDGIIVEYEGNDVTEVGTHIVEAKFYDKYQRLLHKMTAKITILRVYDFTNVVFEDLNVDYDGKPHSIIASNIPEYVNVEYEGNNVIEVGEYTVKAKFYDLEGKLLHEMTALITIYQVYDFSNTIFNGLNVDYDGQIHSVIALNIPNEVTVEYEGNDVSEVGEHIVTAKFYDKYQRLVHKMTAIIVIYQIFDFTNVTFEDVTVDYDNHSHSVFVTNVPDNIIVEYEGNDVMEVGIHKVVAKFYDKYERLLHEMTAMITILPTYDFSNVIFEDASFYYDEQSHSIVALNIPKYVTVEYEGNDVIEIGEHTVIAKFYDIDFKLIHEMTAVITIIKMPEIDFLNVVFKSITVEYDGKSHSIYVVNLPKDCTVVYEGNGVKTIGTHTVTAKIFYKDNILVYEMTARIIILESTDVELPLV